MALKLGIQTLRSYFKIIYEYDFHILPNRKVGAAARGKFVSGAKVLTAVPSISQPRSFLSNFSY